MLLYIVRHGETDWNKAGKVQGRTDIPLNERGRYLAEATAEGMKDVRIDFCYTSPLIRAKETAQIILGEREIPLVEEKRIEEICFGKCEGMKFRGEITDPGSEAFQRFFTDTENYVPSEGAESISELYERTGCFLSGNCRSGGFERQSYFDFNPWSGHDSFVEPDKRKYADKRFLEI